MTYLQKYLTKFQKLFWLKDKERGYSDCKFEVHMHFGFAIATLQLFQHRENVKISIFPLLCRSRNTISSKVFNEFSDHILWLKDDERGSCGLKF